MSTKIHDGQILRKPVGQVYPLALAAADEMRQLQAKEWFRRIALSAVAMLDSMRAGNKVRVRSGEYPLRAAVDRWEHRMAHKEYQSDLDFNLCLFPDGDETLAILFAPRPLREPWDTIPAVEAYGYWDNTDRPEDVTQEAWDERGLRWSRMLRFGHPGAYGIPARSALTLEGKWEPLFCSAADVLANLPSDENRVRTLAMNAAMKAWFAARPADAKVAAHEVSRQMFHLLSGVGKVEMEPFMAEARKAVQPITKEDLLRSFTPEEVDQSEPSCKGSDCHCHD